MQNTTHAYLSKLKLYKVALYRASLGPALMQGVNKNGIEKENKQMNECDAENQQLK